MYKAEDKATCYFDVDDTLILWGTSDEDKENFGIRIGHGMAVPHKRHIEDLKTMKAKGHIIVVWSQGGSDHAAEVVRALDLESYVDVVISKPMWFWDDLHAHEFMSSSFRIWKVDE